MPRGEERPTRLVDVHPKHAHGIDELVDFTTEEARHACIEADVSIVDFTGERIDCRRPFREARVGIAGEPADGAVTHVGGIPVGVVGLLLDLNRLSKANSLEGFVPKQDTFANGVAVFEGNRVIEPENDGLLGTRELSRTFLLFQPPAVDIAAAGFKVAVGAVVLNLGEEMAHAVVSKPGSETRRRQLGEAVTEMNKQAADVGEVPRWRGRGRRRRSRGHERGQGRVLGGVVGDGLNLDVALKGLKQAKGTVFRIEAVRNAEGFFQGVAHHGQVSEEQCAKIDEQALALGMR